MDQDTKTTTLVEFLKARLDEDEQTARTAAAANPGAVATRWSAEQVDYQGATGPRGKAWAVVPERVKGVTIAISPTDIQPRFTTHIARHDPARVLAETEAKRRIIAWSSDPKMNPELIPEAERYYVLTSLALPYADHAGYDESWRP